jgi:hypothetical protein
LKERIERIEGGRFWKRGKRAGGMGKTTIFYLPSLTIQNGVDREADRRRGGRRRPGARRRPGSGAKRRGARGQPVPLLTLGWGALERRINGRRWGCSRWWSGRHWWWRWRAREGGGIGRGGAGCHGEPRKAFYRRGKVGSGRYFELRGAPMADNGGSGKIPVWTPAGGILGRLGVV